MMNTKEEYEKATQILKNEIKEQQNVLQKEIDEMKLEFQRQKVMIDNKQKFLACKIDLLDYGYKNLDDEKKLAEYRCNLQDKIDKLDHLNSLYNII